LMIGAVGWRTLMIVVRRGISAVGRRRSAIIVMRRWNLIVMALVVVVMVVMVIPSGGRVPIGMLLAPMIVALLRMTVAVAEIRMVRRMVVTVLGALRIAEAWSQEEQGGESQHGTKRSNQFDHELYPA
jgi:hypothetical protein